MDASRIFIIKLLVSRVIFVYVLVCDVNVEALQRTAYFRFQTITRAPNTSIISETFTADRQMECAYGCTERHRYWLYYLEDARICHCNLDPDLNVGIGAGGQEIIYGEVESLREESKDVICLWPLRMDCLQLYQDGVTQDGVYTIQPVGGASVNTWCDMTNGGWTVFQRRQDGSENFYRNWTDYVSGFGDRSGEYWLGLEHIYLLILQPSQLNISLVTFGDVTPVSAYASYSTFSIGSSSTNYKLLVGGYEGDCGDSLIGQSGYMFSTHDRDNDAWSSDCAQKFKGAWWYKNCHRSNLNGLYMNGSHTTFAIGVDWADCWGHYYSVKETVMKVRRL